MGSESINLSLSNIWKCWYKFKKGKNSSRELEHYTYYLEQNLYKLYHDLNNSTYRHGGYRNFVVTDNKRRRISVASIQDRIVHRLIYEYLVPIYDKTFIFDAWSCRKNKGLLGAIERTQCFLHAFPRGFIWRADITKFFDNVDREVLLLILKRKIFNVRTLALLKEVINSTDNMRERESKDSALRKGIPIGNLTSQIFANIYLNELDRFIVYAIKPKGYVRYGDDFIILMERKNILVQSQLCVETFLKEKIGLRVNPRNNIILKVAQGILFLGVHIFPSGRRLNKRNLRRVSNRLSLKNISSYNGLMRKHAKSKELKKFQWRVLEKLEEI